MKADILTSLNEAQQQAVTTLEGPVLILAGAGSGKTRTLTHRMAHLIGSGTARPEELLAVTFTNKAAREMQQRVGELVADPARMPRAIGTFHSVGAKLLRDQHRWLNRSASFTILDTADTEKLVKQAMEQSGVSTKEWSVRAVRHELSRAKNALLQPDDIAAQVDSYRSEQLAAIYRAYEQLLIRNDGYDFDDLILEPIRLLSQEESVRAHYRQQWRWLSVDEYQDVNPAQEKLLQLLLGTERHLCVVGDDYQAIYSWRGAKVDHILRFEQEFPDCTTIYLTQNYRSTPSILQAANAVIAENKGQMHKELWTSQDTGDPVQVVALASDRQEVSWIREQITQYVSQGGRAADCVVLYRTNAQSRLLEEEFLRFRIPYTIVGGFRFYDRREVKDALAFLHFWVNRNSSLALTRLSDCLLKGIGSKTLDRWQQEAAAGAHVLADWLETPGNLTPRQQSIVRPLLSAYQHAREHEFGSVADLLRTLLHRSGYLAYVRKLPDGEDRLANIEELYNVAAGYTSLESFLEDVALLSDLDTMDSAQDRVTCMTLHAAKGLEFPRVFLIGCEEELLPHINSIDTPAEIEEERRLFYVGMTRAERALTITYTHQRAVRGSIVPTLPSRFLQALPSEVEQVVLSGSTATEATLGLTHDTQDWIHSSPSTSSSDEAVLVTAERGDFVSHPHFGRGVVIDLAGSTLTCVFEDYGVKQIDGASLQTS